VRPERICTRPTRKVDVLPVPAVIIFSSYS
jgi:hypothetical protein